MSFEFASTNIEINGTPEKRLYWSIIQDYAPETAICELIDNAIDNWRLGGQHSGLKIEVMISPERGYISVTDDGGGVRKDHLYALIAPGASTNQSFNDTIGVFGVGTKRAVVALGREVSIKTRFADQATYQIRIDEEWLASSDWMLEAARVADIPRGTTQVQINDLRFTFDEKSIEYLRESVSERYGVLLSKHRIAIVFNESDVLATKFDYWCYPPEFGPRVVRFTVPSSDPSAIGDVDVEITSGLIADRDAVLENYGVTFYCNDRLVEKHVRKKEVGYYVASEAGVPHPDASLCRVIVCLKGSARDMPWNSSKNSINFQHPTFQNISLDIIKYVRHFTKISRATKNEWRESIFTYRNGETVDEEREEGGKPKKLLLPPLPSRRTTSLEKCKLDNEAVIEANPYILGLLESVYASDLILRQRGLETRTRISLLLLVSTGEIAAKEYLIHHPNGSNFNLKYLFENKDRWLEKIEQEAMVRKNDIALFKYYYDIRSKLIHERGTASVTDTDIAALRGVIVRLMQKLHRATV
jgi:hypothetical protein